MFTDSTRGTFPHLRMSLERLWPALVAVVSVLAPGRALAEEAVRPRAATTIRAMTSDARAEASWRFERGVHLYNEGDLEGALIEFQRAHQLTGHPTVRFNIGLVYAKLGDSLNCVRALEPLVQATTSPLGDEKEQIARRTYAEHQQRVGLLEVKTNVEEAAVQLNNVEAGRVPAPPFEVNAGRHVIAVTAPGYEPQRVSVLVAGQAKASVNVELSPLENALAHLAITTSVPDVDVFAGKELIGTTPFASSIAFKPGVHELSFRRPGYSPEQRTVSVHPGSAGQLAVTLRVDPASKTHGVLKVSIDEPHAVVWVDGEPRLDFVRGIRLPLGRHRLKVHRAGFYELDREVEVAGDVSAVEIELFPTSEYLAQYVADAEAQRTWSWVALGSGATLVGLGAGWLIYNAPRKEDAEQSFSEIRREIETSLDRTCSGSQCDELERRKVRLQEAQDRDVYGWIGVGVGVAAVTTGVVLRVWGEDPDKYEPSGSQDVFGALRVDAGLAGLQVTGSF